MADDSRPEDRFNRIGRIYRQTLEKPEEERLAFLDKPAAATWICGARTSGC